MTGLEPDPVPLALSPSPRGRSFLGRAARVTFLLTVLGAVAVGVEAVARARLGTPPDRIPTSLYTRPVPWGEDREDERRPPVALATQSGAPLEHRIPVPLSDVPDHLTEAVLSVEDHRFYGHHGLDVRRIGGALLANLKAGAITQGGSTITQQLAKNLFLSARRTPMRKLREAAMAVVLELRHDKLTILEAYLNEIYLGQDGGGGGAIHGVGAAARYHFGKDVSRITLAESALLAGMIRAPNRYAPSRNLTAARGRRDLVLRLMANRELITRSAVDRASRANLPARTYPARVVDGRYFRDFAAGAADRLPGRGVAVFTTLDATLQGAAEQAVRAGLGRIRIAGAEAALVAIDPRNGEVLAMVGGREYGASQFNRAAVARRQPGSAFKPVVAVAALEPGPRGGEPPRFTLASSVEDVPLRVKTPGGGVWEPTNYDRQFRGRVTVREAIEQSLNVPFARIGLEVGPERIVDVARRMGITSPLAAVPSLALGSSEVTLLELVRAYGVLAAAGHLAPTRALMGHARYGDELPEPGGSWAAQVIDPAVAYLVTSTLEGAVERGTARGLSHQGHFGNIAGKTGTSNDWRDAWFIGYSPSLVVGAWVGFDDGRPLRLSGAAAAMPIVGRFLTEAAREDDWDSFEVPDGIEEGYVRFADAGWMSECGQREVFLDGTEPVNDGCSGLGGILRAFKDLLRGEPNWRRPRR